ncbi:MAG TPA: GNAT family N-acetyltransferase [Jatrophihabitans sp.]
MPGRSCGHRVGCGTDEWDFARRHVRPGPRSAAVSGVDRVQRGSDRSEQQQSLSVRAVDEHGELAGGLMGWTWATCAGIEQLWVRADQRGSGLGRRLMSAAEDEAQRRGCTQVLVRSFSFQAPDFYRKIGYAEFGRSEGLPTAGHADIHFRKDL